LLLRRDREVTEAEGREWAQAHGLYFIEASAKTAVNVEQVGVALLRPTVAG
jgi:hypothetical protein